MSAAEKAEATSLSPVLVVEPTADAAADAAATAAGAVETEEPTADADAAAAAGAVTSEDGEEEDDDETAEQAGCWPSGRKKPSTASNLGTLEGNVRRFSNTSSSSRASWSDVEEPTLPTILLKELAPLESWTFVGQGKFGIVFGTVFEGKEVVVKKLNEEGRKMEMITAAASPTGIGLFAGEIKVTTYIQGTEGVVKAYGTGVDEEGNAFLVLGRVDFVIGGFLAKPRSYKV